MNSDNNPQIKIRDAKPTDISFIYASWLRSLYYGSNNKKQIKKSIFFDSYKKVIDHILLEADIKIAYFNPTPVLEEELEWFETPEVMEDVIVGYLVYNNNLLHYTFVKEAFRNLGVFRLMLRAAEENQRISFFTHKTDMFESMYKANKIKFTTRDKIDYNPFYLYRYQENLSEE